MRCPECGHEKQKVYDTRPFGEETERRRLCLSCGKKFITYERVEEAGSDRSIDRKRRNRGDNTTPPPLYLML
jgi:transcriptional regulator NrdR family protein